MHDSGGYIFVGFLILSGLVLAYVIAFSDPPMSLYCCGAAGGAVLLRKAAGSEWDRGEGSLADRLTLGLLWNTSKILWALFAGFALVWAVQLGLNQFRDQIDSDQVLAAEVAVSDLARRVERLASVEFALLALLAALVAALILNSLSLVVALGRVRKALTLPIVFLTAVTSFTFLTAPVVARQYDLALAPVRAEIAENLQRAALARRQQAALQWLAAALDPDRRDERRRQTWRTFFRATAALCTDDPSEDGRLIRSASDEALRAICPRDESGIEGLVGARAASTWLPEFAAVIRAGSSSRVAPGPSGPAFAIDSDLRLPALRALRRRASRAAATSEQARDAVRAIVVDAIGDLIGTQSDRLINQVIDVWRDRLIDSFVGAAAARAARMLPARTGAPARPAGTAAPLPSFPLASTSVNVAARVARIEAEERARLARIAAEERAQRAASRPCACAVRWVVRP